MHPSHFEQFVQEMEDEETEQFEKMAAEQEKFEKEMEDRQKKFDEELVELEMDYKRKTRIAPDVRDRVPIERPGYRWDGRTRTRGGKNRKRQKTEEE